MPDFAGSKTQRADIYMQGFSPSIHPRQACSLDCIAKLRFAFHPALPARQLRQTFCSIQHVLFRRHPANTFQTRFLTEHYTLRPPLPTSRRQPDSKLPPTHLFIPAPQSSASQRPPFRLDRPMHSLSHSFFIFFLSFFLFHSTQKKETGKADFLFFLAITNLVQLQSKHLLRNLFHCSSRRPISILFCTGHAVVIHKRHQVICIFDFSLDFGNLLFFFFF